MTTWFLHSLPVIFLNIIIYLNFNRIINHINIFDYPDEKRKLHIDKVPLIGGTILILNSILIFIIYFTPLKFSYFDENVFTSTRNLFSFFFLPLSFYLIGLYDDKYNLDSKTKLFLTSILIILVLLIDEDLIIKNISLQILPWPIPLDSFAIFFTLLCILLFVNAFNMIDGLNLNAGLYALFLLIIIISKQVIILLIISYILSLLLFLFFNNKNKTFLGDNGSLFLSCLLAILFIKFYNLNLLITEEIVILMLIPGLDLFRLSIVRIMSGRHPFSADRNHLHHYVTRYFIFIKPVIFLQIIFFLPFLLSKLVGVYISLITITVLYVLIFCFVFFKKIK